MDKSLSIRSKLIFIILVTSSLAVILSGITIIGFGYLGYRSQLADDLSTQAQVLGINSQIPLAFDDPHDGNTILNALQAAPSVAYASLITPDGSLFASYRRQDFTAAPAHIPAESGSTFTSEWLLVVQEISLGEDPLGKIFIQADLRKLEDILIKTATTIALIVLGALFLTYFLSSWLARLIASPIQKLTQTASKVTLDQNYTVTVEVENDDELGELSKSFNTMMARIAARDQSLEEHKNHLEELVRERTKDLEKAHAEIVNQERLAALGQLTATIAHEIRNPLGTVRTSIFAIEDAIKRNQPNRIDKSLALAERNIQRCDNIITELLDYTRKKNLLLQPINIDDWLNEFIDEQELPTGVECQRDLSANQVAAIDPEYLRRALANVYTNGLQALEEKNNPEKVLGISTRLTPGKLEIHIKDNGNGINKSDHDRIFEPLFSTKGFGVGLGLSIVKAIMEDHKGGIDVTSQSGEYTLVKLWLPIAENETQEGSL